MNDLVNGLFNFFIAIFTIITTPLQAIINTYFPDVNEFAFQATRVLGSFNSQWIPWIKDLIFIPQWAFNLLLGYYLFKFAVSFFANLYTMVLKYWGTLMP